MKLDLFNHYDNQSPPGLQELGNIFSSQENYDLANRRIQLLNRSQDSGCTEAIGSVTLIDREQQGCCDRAYMDVFTACLVRSHCLLLPPLQNPFRINHHPRAHKKSPIKI